MAGVGEAGWVAPPAMWGSPPEMALRCPGAKGRAAGLWLGPGDNGVGQSTWSSVGVLALEASSSVDDVKKGLRSVSGGGYREYLEDDSGREAGRGGWRERPPV
ncbi:unnamed protein product, partial [Discosporangium mesarthrocarpum]